MGKAIESFAASLRPILCHRRRAKYQEVITGKNAPCGPKQPTTKRTKPVESVDAESLSRLEH
jgi:hypothetical protein